MSSRPDDRAERFADVPLNRHLGFRLIARSVDEAVLAMDARPELVQEEGVIHGGVLAALADTAAVYTLIPGLAAGRTMTSVEFKVNFLRPALPDRGPVTARARVVQRGRRIGVCDVEVTQAGRPVARGLFTYLVYEADERRG